MQKAVAEISHIVSIFYFISKLGRALWLVKLAGRTLPHGPLKFQIVFVP